jgi:AbrB family looped-hinge helix DNA binding protein
MRTTIDRAGRVVIPKPLRERAGFKPGMEVEVRFNEGNIEITSPPSKGRIINKGGVWVWHTPGPERLSQETINDLIEEVRNERGRIEDRFGH